MTQAKLCITRQLGELSASRHSRAYILYLPMRQVMQTRTDKQLYLRGDGSVQLQDLMDVFGRLKEAGVEKIGIVAQERRAGR